MVILSPALATTAYCTMKAVTNTTTYVRAESHGYGGYRNTWAGYIGSHGAIDRAVTT